MTIPQVSTWMNMTLRWTLYSYMYFRIHYIHIQFTSKPPLCRVLLSTTLIPTGPAQPSSLCFPSSHETKVTQSSVPQYSANLNLRPIFLRITSRSTGSFCARLALSACRSIPASKKPSIIAEENQESAKMKHMEGGLWAERSGDGE